MVDILSIGHWYTKMDLRSKIIKDQNTISILWFYRDRSKSFCERVTALFGPLQSKILTFCVSTKIKKHKQKYIGNRIMWKIEIEKNSSCDRFTISNRQKNEKVHWVKNENYSNIKHRSFLITCVCFLCFSVKNEVENCKKYTLGYWYHFWSCKIKKNRNFLSTLKSEPSVCCFLSPQSFIYTG